MPFNSPFSYPLNQYPIPYVCETESLHTPRNFYFLEFNTTCKTLWDQTNSVYMHFIWGSKCHVFNAWEWSIWPKHFTCMDGINKICCGWQLYIYQFLNKEKACSSHIITDVIWGHLMISHRLMEYWMRLECKHEWLVKSNKVYLSKEMEKKP